VPIIPLLDNLVNNWRKEMSKDEKAKLAEEILQIRQDIEALYQSAYNAFVASTNEFAKMMQPIMRQQIEISKRLIRLEDKVYKEFEKEPEEDK
jgi:hypothetical protein